MALGFAPISSVPISSLPTAGGTASSFAAGGRHVLLHILQEEYNKSILNRMQGKRTQQEMVGDLLQQRIAQFAEEDERDRLKMLQEMAFTVILSEI
jgi:hypothetical protein